MANWGKVTNFAENLNGFMDNIPSFTAYIEKTLIDNWDKEAFTDYNGERLRYSDVARRIAKLHIGMETLGLKPGDKVAICGRNSANWAVAFFSILSYGCVAVPIQCEFAPEQIHNIVNHSEAKFLYVGDGVAPSIDFEQMPKLGGIGYLPNLSIRNQRIEQLVYVREHLNELFGKKYPKRFTRDDISFRREESPEELAIINYTSGTTGFSKGVMIPSRALWSNLDFAIQNFGPHVKPGDNILSTLPMAHCYGMACEIIFGFINGCHICFLNRQPSPSLIMEAAAKVKPRMLIAVPLVIEKIVRKHVYQRMDRHRARYLLQLPLVKSRVKERTVRWINEQFGGNIYQIMTGGAPMNQEIEKFLMDVGFPITSGYGTTETAPMISFSDWKDHTFGSCGTVVPHMELRILRRGQENKVAKSFATPNEQGEVICRGLSTMLGYYKNQEATDNVLDKDGWFHTGDLGTMSEDGHLFILGRIKNMLLGANGQNIYPEEIEDKLNSMPMVTESLVIQRDQKLVALVYPDQDDINEISLSKDEVALVMEQNLSELNKLLPSFCRISEIKLVDTEFAKTAKRSIKRYLYQ